MRKSILLIITLLTVAVSMAQNVETFDFENFKAHIFTSSEAMHDVSIIIEGESVEPQSFYSSIDEFNRYIALLNKPVVKIISSYHAGGLASYDIRKVVMVEPMVEFMDSPEAKGMLEHFDKAFEGAMDIRSVKVKKTIPTTSIQKWDNIEFKFTPGAESDFPASSINVGNKLFYTHFAPSQSHPSAIQISSRDAVDATLSQLRKANESDCEIFVGSHGAVAKREDVEFMIGYLERVKQLVSECSNSDLFAQRLFVSYPNIEGSDGIKPLAKALYPDEPINSERELVRAQVQKYLDFMSRSEFDQSIAKKLWLDDDKVSFISPAGHFFGVESITGDFMKRIFTLFDKHTLSSICESVNIYGNSANVQIYWKFDTINHKGEANQTRGRESLIYEKVDGEWLLVHVHYSRLPEVNR